MWAPQQSAALASAHRLTMGAMRVGTWNMAGRWGPDHRALLDEAACEVWLLPEVAPRSDLPEPLVRSAEMPGTRRRAWAAIWSNAPLRAVASPHPATAVATTGGFRFCSSVLPWRSAGATWPDGGANTAERTAAALHRLRPTLCDASEPVIWGGDWNHSMAGPERAGSTAGRLAIQELVGAAGLTVATHACPHAIGGLLSIDHIALPARTHISSCSRIRATVGARRLSDHDAYVVDFQ